LSKTPINDRYFSQPDLGGAAGNASYEDRARSSGNLKAQSQFDYPDDQAGGIRRHGNPRFVKSGGRRRNDRSSAMSDTSEAPSVASHVRRVRVPSQASDVDQVKINY
jgi:myosin-15